MNGFSIESPKSTTTKLENGVEITDSNGGRGYITDLPVSKGSYSGHSTSIPNKADPETVRGLTRENESPHILIENGFDVEQNPNIPETPKNPDYKINGYIYDNYAPKTSNTRAIWSAVENKVEAGQTNNVVINLADSKASTDSVVKQFNEYSIKGLGNILIIDNNSKVINLGWKEK